MNLRRAIPAAVVAGVTVLAAVTLPAVASTPKLAFRTVKLAGSSGLAEPRVTVTRKGVMFAVTNAGRPNDIGIGPETVYRSTDGIHWKRTAAQPPDQNEATTDVDIVATRTGRIISSELDYGGINFRTSYSDNGGRTWTESVGTTAADTDRQWYAVGPNDPSTHQPRVYMLFHNLLSGVAQHNMWVSTSRDGGATFGPPVPVSIPGQQDYLDLQCADSGGPSNIMVDQRTGRVMVVFGTRSSPAGGCGGQPAEVNVVAANRVWVVSAPAAKATLPGGWTPHLAVNDTGPPAHIVGMQLAPGTLDTAGNVYVAYPESVHDYPNYDGAAIKVVHAMARNLDKWSRPTVVAKPGGAGNILPHIVAGRPGRVDVAWYHGIKSQGRAPDWYSYAAQSLDALGSHPHWTSIRLSKVRGEAGQTASQLMGACIQGQGAVLNGFACSRSTDVNGIAIDKRGRLVVIWPAQANLPTDGTYVSMQTRGPTLLR
ncbi:MAG: exo-alpha-sialidase [Frankiales bacterium]|nr:exo-alpha-sialidase [Frankiales bacterium]